MRRIGGLAIALLIGLAIGAALIGTLGIGRWFGAGPDPVSIASASLEAARAQNRLTVFAARFVAVVTSEQQRFGLSARKTLIMPGDVRYDVDLARLRAQDVRWDAAAHVLSVTLPPVEPSRPAIDLAHVSEYSGGGLLMSLTEAERTLDAANRTRGEGELMRQARAPLTLGLARDAAKAAIARSFALPLKAAGVDGTVAVRFADEGRRSAERWDVSRPMAEVYEEAQQAGR